MTGPDLSDYVDVASRITEFRGKHPAGALQPADLAKPFEIMTLGDATFVVVIAAAYRHEHDTRPGIGMAWEPFPGRTPYTRGSELQNAETSAWGRAIVAALAADTKRGVASADEVRNRQADREHVDEPAHQQRPPSRRTRPAASQTRPDQQQAAGGQLSPGDEDTDAPPLITQAQSRKLHAAFGQLGIQSRDARVEAAAAAAGRPISSSRELTKVEASRLIDALEHQAAQ